MHAASASGFRAGTFPANRIWSSQNIMRWSGYMAASGTTMTARCFIGPKAVKSSGGLRSGVTRNGTQKHGQRPERQAGVVAKSGNVR